jgi:hypothetical protein
VGAWGDVVAAGGPGVAGAAPPQAMAIAKASSKGANTNTLGFLIQ